MPALRGLTSAEAYAVMVRLARPLQSRRGPRRLSRELSVGDGCFQVG
jgi:hypothetical protein